MDVRGIMGLIIVLVVGLAMTPVITTAVSDAIKGENKDVGVTDDDMTGASKTMIELVPLFYVIGLLLAAVAWATKEFGKKG
ncbi:unnamed protein product [marine sediment metagenome]|uniref:Uncharacterized protein n=1 Tax=marine sediment metagenome TaxID=412755 RepID=X1JDW6_9ZZZZ